MFKDDHYNRKRIISTVFLTMVVYILCLAMMAFQAKDVLTSEQLISNYDKSFKSEYKLNSNKSKEDVNVNITLRDVEYNISSMYLDYTEIEKERAKQKKEYELTQLKSTINKKPLTTKVEGSMLLPNLNDTSFKGYMCIHKVSSKKSKQYEFLHSGLFDIKSYEHGIITYKDYYVVAMASYYTNYKIGSTFRITLSSGVVFEVIAGDMKSDMDTDGLKMYRPKGSNRGEIVEFIIACGDDNETCSSYNALSDKLKSAGSLSSVGLQGDVVKVEKLDDVLVVEYLYK